MRGGGGEVSLSPVSHSSAPCGFKCCSLVREATQPAPAGSCPRAREAVSGNHPAFFFLFLLGQPETPATQRSLAVHVKGWAFSEVHCRAVPAGRFVSLLLDREAGC